MNVVKETLGDEQGFMKGRETGGSAKKNRREPRNYSECLPVMANWV
jgi:hypothetical protein